MSVFSMGILIEDVLSEVVARRMLAYIAPRVQVDRCLNRGGYGYIKRILPGLNKAAPGYPFLVITDLDMQDCPAMLASKWLNGQHLHNNLLFRVAVREIEAWLLAHRDGLSMFLGFERLKTRIPLDVDSIKDPKKLLVELASKSQIKDVRRWVPPAPGSTAAVGREYNSWLCRFVREAWDVALARKQSDSLDRAVRRIEELVNRG